MLQPKKPLDLSEANQILQSERKPLDLSSAEAILKKKESTESTSTIQESNGDSVQTIGSSGTVGSNGFPAIDVNLGVPGLKPDLKTVEQLANPPKSKATIQAEQNNALKYEKFKQFSTLPDEIKKENAQKVEDEANGVGFLNNVATFGKEAYNTVIEGMSNTPMTAGLKQLKVNTEPLADEKKEAKDLMIRQGVKPKDINSNTILELAKKIKLQKLNDSDIESRKKEFLSNTEVDFEDLQKGANVELSKISNKDKELLKQKAILEPVLRDSDNRLTELNKQLANFKKNNQQPTPEFVDEYNYAIKYHNDILKDVQKTDNQFADNRDKIGDLKTNLDLFKRQYGKVNNFVSNIGATALDLAAGGFGIVDYGFNAAYGALGIDTGPKENSEIVTGLRGASKNIRDRIAKPINIDNIEDVYDFGDWMANTVIANQVPIYGLIATGPGGIVALGGSSLGTKYGDMVQEMNPDNPVEGQILKNYSNAELGWKPVGFGIAETASALVDAHIMKGAARVLASATQPERRLISQTIAKRLLETGKETIKGGATEAVDEMATQGVENIIDGKPFTEGMKDAGGAGAAMGALIPFFAGNIAVATKSFSIDNKIQNSAKKTIALEKELANPNLSEDAKKIIKTNFEESKKTTENLLKKKVKDISKMPNENFQEILRIENEQAKLKEKAVEIKTQDGISDNIKKQLLSDFSNKFNNLETDRLDILSGKKTMPKIENENEKPQEIAVTEQIVETQPQAEVPKQSENKKVIIPDEIKDSHSRALQGHQESIADLEKKLAEEKALPWLKRDRQEQKWIEEDIKFHKESAKMLEENPIQYYKDWIEKDKERHNRQLKEKFKDDNGKTYKEHLIEKYGSDKYEDVYSGWIESVNDKIAKLEEANKSQTEVQKQPEAEKVAEVATVSNEPIVYKVPALLPKKFNADSENTLMTESELELLDAKAEKIIENPREDVSDRIRIQQGNAFTIQDLDAIEQFFKARREGLETRSFSDWRKNTNLENNETASRSNIATNGDFSVGNEPMGEMGIEQKPTAEVIAEENIQPSNEAGAVQIKQEPSLDDIADFVKQQFLNKPEAEKKEPAKKAEKQPAKKEEETKQAKGFISIALDKLTTSLKDFQGRGVEYSKQTYDRIVNEAKEGILNISAIPPVQIWKDPKTGEFVILAGHSRTKAFSDLANGEIQYDSKYKKSDFTNINAQIVEAETLQEAQKIAQESNQGAVQTVVDNAKYVRENLLPTFNNFNQAKTKLKSLYGSAWARIYAYANLNPKGKAMQMLKQFQEANESDSNDKSKKIAEWTGKARQEFSNLTDAHENEIFDYLSKNDKIKTYTELGELLNRRVNGLEEFNVNEPLNFEQKVGRGSNEVEIVKQIQDLKNRDAEIKKKIRELQSFGKNINDIQKKQIKDLTAESIKINTVDIPNAQIKQKQARVADAEQFDIFSQINEQIENGNITPEQVDEFVNDDRKAEEIEPIVEAIESKAKNAERISKEELEKGIADAEKLLENKAKENNDLNVPDEYYEKFQKDFPNTLLAIEEKNGLITIFENGETREVQDYEFVKELKNALAKGYKGIGKVTRKVVDTETKKLKDNAEKSILNSDKDLLGNEKEEAMIPLTYEENPDFNVDDVVYIKSDKGSDKFGKRNQYSVRGKDENGKYVLWGKANGANLNVNPDEIERGVNQKRYPLTGSLDAIDYAMGEKLYSEWVKEGRMSASDAKTIIESAGFNVPSDIEKLARKNKANAEVDKYVQKIKDILPGINDPDLKKQGISQDDLIDLVANAVKALVSKGIDINDAIRQVIASIKERFNVDVDENLVKEKLGVEKPKSKNKNPLREKSSEEIADELGISHDDYLDLKGLVANEPSSGIFNEYLSAETIADVFGDSPTNDQQYEQMVLLNAAQHGNSVLEKARSIFGENYMSKTLEFLQNVKLGNFEKAMVYAALENEIDTLVKSNPSNKVFLATQRLIYADSQANLRNSSKGLNAGRLRRIHNAIKNGYDVDKVTSGLIKPEQQEAKQILKDAIPTGDNLNKASEEEENTEIEKPRVYTQEEFEAELKKAVQATVGKNRNELSKKGKDIADKIRRLKLNKDVARADLSLGAYDLAIEAIAQLVEKGATVAQAIKNVLSDVKYKDIDADKLRQDILGVVNTPRIKDVVKQALIDAGFSREITVTKNAKDANGNDIIDADGKKKKVKETKEVLDWNKLTGRMNSVEALRSNVEGKLKEQGYTDSQIEEISNELETEYKRLTEYIADKALTELERRNQIPKPVNRKSDLDRLVDYHNKGLFGESAKGYERLINKIVGITKREQDVLDKIEAEIEKIKNLREVKIDGSFPDAQSIESQASYIAKSIRNIIAWANLVNSPLKLKAITILSDIAGISRAAVLGNLYNAFQNIYSNNRAGFLARMKFKAKGYWTPELNDAFNELKKTVTSDVLLNRGLDFGDTVSPFSNHSIFIEKIKDYINKKYPEGVKRQRAIGVLNTFEGRLFLNVMDSRFKSKIVNIDFVMNLVDVLTSERAGKSKMTKEEAVNFVSESLTGVNLEKAKVLAKKFIDDVNAMKEGTLLKNEDNIKRLAFDIVRENLTSGNNFTMDEINDIYQASMKSGGVNIGHESNNIVSEELKSLNNRIEKKIEDAMKEKDYDKATKYATYGFISKNILYPYMSGGLNWAVLEAEAGTPLGLATGAYKSYKNKNIDLLTDVGKKRMKEDLINKRDAESKLFRGIWGTSIAISAYLAYYGLQAVSGIGDDDEENKRNFNKYLREHPEQRKIFDKFSPEVYAVSLAVSDERLSKYLLNKMGYKTDQNDNVLTLLKSLQNKNSSTAGALGVLLGQIVSTPGAWRILRDSKRLFRELQGEPMAQTEQRVTSFLNGYFKGALVDYLGLRPGTNYDLEKVKKEIQNKKADFTNYTNGIANDINSKKITIEDAEKLVDKKYEGNDELLDKAKEIIQNSVNDKEIREGLKDADIWYMEMYNEKDIRAKAYIYYQNVLSKKDFKEDKNFSKYMNLALFGKEEEYITEFMDLAIEYKDIEESKNKPIN